MIEDVEQFGKRFRVIEIGEVFLEEEVEVLKRKIQPKQPKPNLL